MEEPFSPALRTDRIPRTIHQRLRDMRPPVISRPNSWAGYVAQVRTEQTDTQRRPIRAGVRPVLIGRMLPGGVLEVTPCE